MYEDIAKLAFKMESVKDSDGRLIHLYLNSSKHIINRHNKLVLWAKHWRNVIERTKPEWKNNTLLYREKVNGHTMEIRVVKENGQFIIKTAIMVMGAIKGFRRQ